MSAEPRRVTGWRAYARVLRHAGGERRGWAVIAAVTLLVCLLSLLQPWPFKFLVDHVLGHEPVPAPLARLTELLPGGGTTAGLLTWVVIAGLALFAANSLADVVLTRAWIRVGQGMVYKLAADLFARLQRRSLLFHTRTPVGDSMSRVTGDSWCAYKLADTLLFAPAQALLMTVGMVVLMVGMDPGLTLLALAVAPFIAASSFPFGRRFRRLSRRRREIESRIQSHVQQILTGIPVVQAFGQEEHEQQRFREYTGEALRAQQRAAVLKALVGLASGLIATLGTGAILWLGATRVLHGQLTVGSLLVFLAYLTILQAQFAVFTKIYTTLQEISAGVERVLEVLGSEPEVSDAPGAEPLPAAARGHVRLEGVSFGYEPGRPVLRGVSLEALPGQTVALVGATGAGKTTLAGLLPRLFDPWEGRVLLDGRDVRGVQLRSLRSQVALVLQDPFLFPRTVAENIAYGRPGASREEVEAAARAANAHEFVARLPQGYDTVVGERGATLSGGERQRLSIARAFLKGAPVLILDEPTSALDAQTEHLVLEALRRLMEGRTALIIAHRLSTIRRADKIVVLDRGAVAEAGTHDELIAHGGLYARLHALQSGERGQRVCKAG